MNNHWIKYGLVPCIGALLSSCAVAQTGEMPTAAPVSKTAWKFSFGEKAANGALQVAPTTLYTRETGYGFEPGSEVVAGNGFFTSKGPFRFSAAVPEGNYRVTVVLGDKAGESNNTIKVEARRLMLENLSSTKGQLLTRSFTVNIHSPQIAGGGRVRLTSREAGPPAVAHWDDKLTIEFNGSRSAVSRLEIVPETNAATVFIAGDSTVTDQFLEPWAAWGQMLPRFFKPSVAVANYAESGLSLPSFRSQKRLDKITSLAKTGDYVFVQFGHNDQKDKRANAGAFTTYKADLLDYVKQIRDKGATPVLVTPMERRRWQDGKPQPTLANYAEAVRQVGTEEKVAVIDLNAQSLKFYEALGEENSKRAFVFVGNTKDNTHFSDYGAYELARVVVEGIKTQVPALAPQLTDGIAPFDPSKPDSLDTFAIPASLITGNEKPAGS